MRWMAINLALVMSVTLAHADEDRETAFRGKRLAEVNCATCHALAQFDASTDPAAPPLRDLGASITLADLREMLRGGVFLKHAIMPDFEPTRAQANDLATYINSIASPK